MKKDFYRNILIIALFVIGITILLARSPEPRQSTGSSREIDNIKALSNPEAQGVELKKLLERVGPLEAQEQMLRSGLPFTGQTHLLIHVVGDYVYEKFGPEGLPYCKDYFLSACYHGFIINTLADHGMQGMVEAMERCNAAAPGVSAQCAHAAGHGFVAWHDYDLIKGAEMCDELGGKVENFGHFNCYDGVFMENVWGVHDGKPSEKRWVKDDDAVYPCNDPRIPEKYLKGCWANQATLAYQFYKGDLRKTAMVCDTVADTGYKETCYNNFSRQIHPITKGDISKVFSLCGTATGKDWQDYCVLTNMRAFWSVGDRQTPYGICDRLDSPLKDECFTQLIGMIDFHYRSLPEEKKAYCDKISSETHRQTCKS